MAFTYNITEGLILAAGYGSRAQPLSNYVPKPLFPVGNGVALDYALKLFERIPLKPYVATGYKGELVEDYVLRKHKNVFAFVISSPSTNLLESVVAAGQSIKSDAFLWTGGAMFIENEANIHNLLQEHTKYHPFCTLFTQTTTRYKPKLVIKNGKLVQFVVGEYDTPYSSPTIFAVSREFIKYARQYPETNVFQQAIRDGKEFRLIPLLGKSIEIHTLQDYFLVSKMLYPYGFTDDNSVILESNVTKSYIYGSTIRESRIRNSILINASVTDVEVEGRIIYGKEINVSIPEH